MSDTPIEVLRVHKIHDHPKADRLQIVKVLGTQFIATIGDFEVGDLVIYFPPDMLIPEDVAEDLGVKAYLKHAVYPGDTKKSQCRIGAIRLRGIPSYGFGIKAWPRDNVGDNLTDKYGGVKYQPPVKSPQGDQAPDIDAFHKYTDIQHYWKNTNVFEEGEHVRITEKLHGANCRLGYVKVDGESEFVCGSHNTRRKSGMYWTPLDRQMMEMLKYITFRTTPARADVIVFGELYGNGVQNMDYGTVGVSGFAVFDISVDGAYLDWVDVCSYCDSFGIETVPLIYKGPFKPELIDQFISGPTLAAMPSTIKCKFLGREGVVIVSLKERYDDVLGRVILKAVSPEYLGREQV